MFGRKKKDTPTRVVHYEGVPGFPTDFPCTIQIVNDIFVIKRITPETTVDLPLSRITAFSSMTEANFMLKYHGQAVSTSKEKAIPKYYLVVEYDKGTLAFWGTGKEWKEFNKLQYLPLKGLPISNYKKKPPPVLPAPEAATVSGVTDRVTNIERRLLMFGKPKAFTSVGPLIDGLPVPAYTMITAKLFPDGFHITAITGKRKEDWPVFTLAIDKIQNVQLMDERQIQQVIQQSAPGMILGAAAFGILGTMVGGRVTTKEKVKISTLLVIDYESNGPKQIVLDVSGNLPDTKQVVKQFHTLKPVAPKGPVEL